MRPLLSAKPRACPNAPSSKERELPPSNPRSFYALLSPAQLRQIPLDKPRNRFVNHISNRAVDSRL